MKSFYLAAALLAAIGVSPAWAVTATFCGPDSEGGTCEGPSEVKVFLDAAKATALGFGDIGSQKSGAPVMDLSSDGGMLNLSIDLSSGFGTITPAHGFVDFNGLDITIPGFTFTDIAFDAQLTPVSGQSTDSFTISAFSGAHVSDGVGTEFDAADTDKQFSATAVGGAFDEVNIKSLTGFDEIKHIEISGLAPVVSAVVPEASTWAMLITGFGLIGLSALWRKRASRLSAV
jgi:hypothetical protein